MKYGYARVSTDDQSTALQLAALKRAGCKTFFKDQGLSGATTKRPALLRCLKALQDGDTLIVWKLDRLGRSLRDLIAISWHTLRLPCNRSLSQGNVTVRSLYKLSPFGYSFDMQEWRCAGCESEPLAIWER